MAGRIQVRRGTAAAATTADPTLTVGEFGFEHDTGRLKVGNGTTAWSDLPYVAAEVNAKGFGAIGDTSTDDTVALQAAIDGTPEGGLLHIPDGTYTITSDLVIDKTMSIEGHGQYTTIIRANGCNGITIAEGVSAVMLSSMDIASATRYTTTTNTLKGIEVLGSTGSRPSNHVYKDLLIDGFQTGIETNWLWSSSIRNVKTGNGLIGLWAKGLSVNNFVTHSSFSGNAGSGSRGIIIGDGTTATEGWVIGDTLTYANEIGIEGIAATHCKVHDCIVDYNYNTGIVVRAGTSNFGGNWEIHDNYIAVAGASGDSGIGLTNTISNSQDRGCRVSNNLILAYSGATCNRGIKATASQSKRHNLIGNTITGMALADIDAAYDADITIFANKCLSAIATHIYGGTQVGGNTGVQYYARASQRFSLGRITFTYDEAVPTTGTWAVGDVCWKVNAAAGGTPGWVCTTAGTPGTWKAMANLAA